jgi:hypothetical protein
VEGLVLEVDVEIRFAAHASHCKDPFHVYVNGDTLCERGHGLFHIYSKASKAYSVVDRNAVDSPRTNRDPPTL